MIKWYVALGSILLLTFCAPAATLKLPSLTAGSTTYSNVTVIGANATDLYFTHDQGIGNVKLKYLNADLQQRFNYNAQAAAQAEKKQAEADALYQTTLAATMAAQAEKARAEAAPAPMAPIWSDPVSDKSLLGKPGPRLEVEKWTGEKPALEGKYVLVTFWAPWSSACRQSITELNALQKKFPEKLVVVGICTNSPAEISQVTDPKPDFANASDTKARLSAAAGVTSIPCALLIDPKGVVRYQGHPAALTEKSLQGLFARPTD
jgi:cytochrome c biogenesis protein CcmG/thiol:disulfide interchange protein DsbE